MSTYDRFTKALRANLNDLMERAARGDDVRATVRRFEELAKETRGELRAARGHLADLEIDVRRSQGEAAELEARAMAALRTGDEPAARARLSDKMDTERDGRELAALVAEERGRIRELEEVIGELEDKIGPAIDWARKSKAEKLRAEAEAKAEKQRLKSEKGKASAKGSPPAPQRDEIEEEAWRELSRDLGEEVASSAAPPRDELKDLKDKLRDDDRKR